ncbi:hypothetical protein COO60DRAFT_1233484 [Scenedesmus sp. NREL 46B-D3]|nr:hypothetical protein COO60DRAFT_1233484 [Scenedesmus sp. NREL 46B-D3]
MMSVEHCIQIMHCSKQCILCIITKPVIHGFAAWQKCYKWQCNDSVAAAAADTSSGGALRLVAAATVMTMWAQQNMLHASAKTVTQPRIGFVTGAQMWATCVCAMPACQPELVRPHLATAFGTWCPFWCCNPPKNIKLPDISDDLQFIFEGRSSIRLVGMLCSTILSCLYSWYSCCSVSFGMMAVNVLCNDHLRCKISGTLEHRRKWSVSRHPDRGAAMSALQLTAD